jgi:hypothetical protein
MITKEYENDAVFLLLGSPIEIRKHPLPSKPDMVPGPR